MTLLSLAGLTALVSLAMTACNTAATSGDLQKTVLPATILPTVTYTPSPTLEPTSAEQTLQSIVDRRFTQAYQTQVADLATSAIIATIDNRVHDLQTGTAMAMPTGSPTPSLEPSAAALQLQATLAVRSTELAQIGATQTAFNAYYATRDAIVNPHLTETAAAYPTATSTPPNPTQDQQTLSAAIIKKATEIPGLTAVAMAQNTRDAQVYVFLTQTAAFMPTPTPLSLNATEQRQTLDAVIIRRSTDGAIASATAGSAQTLDAAIGAVYTATAQAYPTPTINPTDYQGTLAAALVKKQTELAQQTATAHYYETRDAQINPTLTALAPIQATPTASPTLGPTEQALAQQTLVIARVTDLAQQTATANYFATRDAIVNPRLTQTAAVYPTPTEPPLSAAEQEQTLSAAVIKRSTEAALETQVAAIYATRDFLINPRLTQTAQSFPSATFTPTPNAQEQDATLQAAVVNRSTQIASYNSTLTATAIYNATYIAQNLANATATAQVIRLALSQGLTPLDVSNGAQIKELNTLKGHTAAVTSVTFSPDGSYIASSGQDNTVRQWDAQSGNSASVFQANTNRIAVAYSPDGGLIAAASGDGTVRVYESRTSFEKFVLEQPVNAQTGRRLGMTSVSFSPDNLRLATGNEDGTAVIWDMRNGGKLLTLTAPRGPASPVTSVAFSPDGTRVAGGTQAGIIRVWESVTDFQLAQYSGAGVKVTSITFSNDGTLLASSDTGGTIQIRNAATGAIQFTVRIQGAVNGVSLSTDGTRIAAACADRNVRIWDVQKSALIATLSGHTGPVNSVSFSSDNARLASGSDDTTIKVWGIPKS